MPGLASCRHVPLTAGQSQSWDRSGLLTPSVVFSLSQHDVASPLMDHMLFCLFSQCQVSGVRGRAVSVSWGISLSRRSFPTPSLAGRPRAQLCQAWRVTRRPGCGFVVSLGCTPPSPRATFAHFSWELPSCRERPLEPECLFNQPLLNFTSIFFPFPNRSVIYLGL